MAEKLRYTDEELEEFRQIINEKLALAKRDYDQMMASLTNQDSNDVDDTSPTYKALEEGSATQSKEDLIQFAARQQKFIQGLKAALVRIENKTYEQHKSFCIKREDGGRYHRRYSSFRPTRQVLGEDPHEHWRDCFRMERPWSHMVPNDVS